MVSGKKLWWSTSWRTIDALLTLSDSENESDDEEILDIVEPSDDSDGEERAINSVVFMERS